MKRRITVTFFLICLFISDCVSQPAICSYKYRKRITFDHTKVSGSSDLIDFPVLINIDNDNTLEVIGTAGNTGQVANSNGYDIVFTADDGVTLLDHQLIRYNGSNNNGDLQCWVKIPNLSASFDTHIYMYYGGSSTATDPSSTSVWSNGYVGVWHFYNSLNNATATGGLNGTNNGTSNSTTSPFTNGNARQFTSGSSQYIDVTPYNSVYDITGDITVSAWIRLSSNNIDQKIAGNQNNTATSGGWKFGVYTDGKVEFEIRTSNNASTLNRGVSGGTALSNTTWYYVVGQYSDVGDFIRTYVNGNIDRAIATNAVLGTSPGTMKFGREPFSTGGYFNGIMAEVRLSNVIRSADWIATEYNNQSSPTTFYTISGAPEIWIGGTGMNTAQRTSWNRNGNWADGSIAGAGADVILSPTSTNQPNLDINAQVNSLWVLPSVTLTIPNQNLSVYRDITNCGVINCTNANSLVQLNSNPAYTQNQYLSGDGTYSLQDLTVNNTFGTDPMVILNSSVNVNGDLVLTSGIVSTTSANILALGSGATSTGGSASSFVSGPMSKTGNTNFVFPVGKGSRWRRIGISSISVATATFRAEYFDAAYTNTTPVSAPLNNVSTVEYWQLDRLSASGNANVSLYWESASGSGINNCPDLTIARWNGTTWNEHAANTVSGSSCAGTGTGTITTSAVVTAFSPFTFGSKTFSVNVLPIELIDFEVICKGQNATFYWSTASEKNNDYFGIEFSKDGNDWLEIAKIKGAGNSSKHNQYSYLLENAVQGYF